MQIELWKAVLLAVVCLELGVLFGAWWGGREARYDYTEEEIQREEEIARQLLDGKGGQ